MSASIVRALDRACYPDYQLVWDDAVCREMILSLIEKQHVVLDVGAGGGGQRVRLVSRLRG